MIAKIVAFFIYQNIAKFNILTFIIKLIIIIEIIIYEKISII